MWTVRVSAILVLESNISVISDLATALPNGPNPTTPNLSRLANQADACGPPTDAKGSYARLLAAASAAADHHRQTRRSRDGLPLLDFIQVGVSSRDRLNNSEPDGGP